MTERQPILSFWNGNKSHLSFWNGNKSHLSFRNGNKPHLSFWNGAKRSDRISIKENMYYVYIITNKTKTVLYTGVTNDLERRINEHKTKMIDGFTKRYNVDQLVYYETTSDVKSAIVREKQIKNLLRRKKEDLINSMNPNWDDLMVN